MPAINYTYTVVYTPQTSDTTTRIKKLPTITDCPSYAIAGWVNERSEGWNCNYCPQDMAYFSRYEVGDILPFMLRLPDLYNTNIDTPLNGWNYTGAASYYVKASLYGAGVCDDPLLENVDEFCSDWWVSYNTKVGSYQALFVDTALIALAGYKNFRILVEWFDSTNAKVGEVWSENFMQIECDEFSFVIDSYYDNTDCFNYCYTTPISQIRFNNQVYFHTDTDPVGYQPTRFSLRRRYLGQIVFDANSSESTLDDKQNILKQDIVESYKLYFQDFLPPYEAKILGAQVRGNLVYVDNEIYKNFGQISRKSDKGTMFLINDLTCQKICRINNRSCD